MPQGFNFHLIYITVPKLFSVVLSAIQGNVAFQINVATDVALCFHPVSWTDKVQNDDVRADVLSSYWQI